MQGNWYQLYKQIQQQQRSNQMRTGTPPQPQGMFGGMASPVVMNALKGAGGGTPLLGAEGAAMAEAISAMGGGGSLAAMEAAGAGAGAASSSSVWGELIKWLASLL